MSRSIHAAQGESLPYNHHLHRFLTFLKHERGFADAAGSMHVQDPHSSVESVHPRQNEQFPGSLASLTPGPTDQPPKSVDAIEPDRIQTRYHDDGAPAWFATIKRI